MQVGCDLDFLGISALSALPHVPFVLLLPGFLEQGSPFIVPGVHIIRADQHGLFLAGRQRPGPLHPPV